METLCEGVIRIMKDPAIDLKTMLTSDFVHTNVAGLTADPNIRYLDSDPPDTYPTNGEIIINNETGTEPLTNLSYQTERYIIDCDAVYEKVDATAPTIIKGILGEIERVFNAENLSNTRTYDWLLNYTWDGSFRVGVISFLVIAIPLTYAVNT
jgi:hypothetical protein